ncbi:MAG TPA: hypothetical protein VLC46_22975 [Thermoanaerobaculia bacterium]|nr:hypothetical protein [Thermoanaerobaculia bacterium]
MPQKKIAMPQKKIAMPQKKIAMPQKKIAMPQKKIAMPQKKIAVPQKKIAVPPKKIAIPQKSGCFRRLSPSSQCYFALLRASRPREYIRDRRDQVCGPRLPVGGLRLPFGCAQGRLRMTNF